MNQREQDIIEYWRREGIVHALQDCGRQRPGFFEAFWGEFGRRVWHAYHAAYTSTKRQQQETQR